MTASSCNGREIWGQFQPTDSRCPNPGDVLFLGINNQTQNQNQDTTGGAKPYAANRAKWLGLSHILCGCVTFLIDTIKMVIFLEVSLQSYEMYFSYFYPKYFSRAMPPRLQSPGSSRVDSQWLVRSPRPDAWSLQPWWDERQLRMGWRGFINLKSAKSITSQITKKTRPSVMEVSP